MTHKSRWPRLVRRSVLLSLLTLAAVVGTAFAAAGGRDGGAPAQGASIDRQVQTLIRENGAISRKIAVQLVKTKQALDKYRSVAAAKAAGYVQSGACAFSVAGAGEESSHPGGMGVHFTSDAALKDGKLIATKPEVLVYAPTPAGLQLVAAEYFQPDADQSTKTDGDRPSIFGRALDGPMLGHAPGMPIHDDLHVWLWKHNPSGLFAPWNPDVSCS